jgi:hypothetical protein
VPPHDLDTEAALLSAMLRSVVATLASVPTRRARSSVGTYGRDHPVGFLGGKSIRRGSYPIVDAPFGRMGTIMRYDMDFSDTARVGDPAKTCNDRWTRPTA